MRKILVVILAISLFVCVVASAEIKSTGEKAEVAANVLRPLPGDNAEYRVVGKTKRDGSSVDLTGSSKRSIKVSPLEPDGKSPKLADLYALCQEVEIFAKGVSQFSTKGGECFGFDSIGNTYKFAEASGNKNWQLVRTQALPLELPAELSIEKKWLSTCVLPDSTTKNTSIVLGTEVISTPAGEFFTYKVEKTTIIPGEGPIIDCQWISPKLGFPIKEEVQIHDTDVEVDLVYTLQSYHLAKRE